MPWMLKGGLVMTDARDDAIIRDIVIDGDSIVAVGPDLDPSQYGAQRVVAAADKLLIPGLVNTHYHSHDRWDRGRFSTLPLELWMSLYNPPTVGRGWTAEETYLRTLLGGMELLRGGTTTVLDDVHLGLQLDHDIIDAVFRAYDDLGLRASVGIAYADRPAHETIPYLDDFLPDRFKGPGQTAACQPQEMLAKWCDLARRWTGKVRAAISVSGPQRCSERFQQEAAQLSGSLGLPFLTHVLETRVQAMSGPYFYGCSLVSYMERIGALPANAVLMHGVWMSADDLDGVARSGAAIAYNPASNLKLGSGIAPVVEMLERGITVGLGTDNHNANDGCSMFEALKWGTLLQTMATHDYRRWPDARTGLAMATAGGAGALGRSDSLGSLQAGCQADILVFNLSADAFVPLNDVAVHLSFVDTTRALESAYVGGQLVLDHGRIVTVDEPGIRSAISDRVATIKAKVLGGMPAAQDMAPYLHAAYTKCLADPLMKPYLGRCNCCM